MKQQDDLLAHTTCHRKYSVSENRRYLGTVRQRLPRPTYYEQLTVDSPVPRRHCRIIERDIGDTRRVSGVTRYRNHGLQFACMHKCLCHAPTRSGCLSNVVNANSATTSTQRRNDAYRHCVRTAQMTTLSIIHGDQVIHMHA